MNQKIAIDTAATWFKTQFDTHGLIWLVAKDEPEPNGAWYVEIIGDEVNGGDSINVNVNHDGTVEQIGMGSQRLDHLWPETLNRDNAYAK